jgi:hypothetical protein
MEKEETWKEKKTWKKKRQAGMVKWGWNGNGMRERAVIAKAACNKKMKAGRENGMESGNENGIDAETEVTRCVKPVPWFGFLAAILCYNRGLL